jgi:hypothetical protein
MAFGLWFMVLLGLLLYWVGFRLVYAVSPARYQFAKLANTLLRYSLIPLCTAYFASRLRRPTEITG